MASSSSQPARRLQRSVLSSSSDRLLEELMREVREVSGVRLFDLLMLRYADIRDIEDWAERKHLGRGLLPPPPPTGQFDHRTTTEILAVDRNFELIREFIADQFDACNSKRDAADPCRISALATFFPEISSRSQGHERRPDFVEHLDNSWNDREVAIRALTNTVRLGLDLKNPSEWRAPRGEAAALSMWAQDHVVVEAVCGTVLDRCDCPDCRNARPRGMDYAMEGDRGFMVTWLLDGLREVCQRVTESAQGKSDSRWVIALELEPGPAYVVNGTDSLKLLVKGISKYPVLAQHVGLNVDIAHYRIADVQIKDIRECAEDHVVHAHICDHPGMHTRDQIVGSWEPVDFPPGSDRDYLRWLHEIGHNRRSTGVPFTGTVALELEGCGRIAWIHQSLVAAKQAIEFAAQRVESASSV